MTSKAGVLGLQGDYAAHGRVLAALGLEVVQVRRPADLAGLRMLALPGGESTTMSLLLDDTGLREPLTRALLPLSRGGGGLPVLATCAGVILIARELLHDDGSIKVRPLEVLDAAVDRNAYGRQVQSFEAGIDVDWDALGLHGEPVPFHAVFIRAPRMTATGPGVQTVARFGADAVLLRQENILAAAFHPELSGDTRLHRAVLGWSAE